ncbi:unnamed protein product, partial [marine sediment metagenome]
FPISVDYDDQYYPAIQFADDTYYVFWEDYRFYPPDRSIYAARVTSAGTVIDSAGRLILRDKAYSIDAAFDGVNFLAVIQNDC